MANISLDVWQFEFVSHVLTLGYAAMTAALFYFILTKNNAAPKYRPSNVLSVVVMVSAAILLFMQQQSWQDAFVLNAARDGYEATDALFTNGYRYLNWLIDVPMLLIQILFVAGITGLAFKKYFVAFATSGTLMIVTGYIGQFFEPGRDSENILWWIIWGLISTAFYVIVLIKITQVIKEGKSNMEGSSAKPLFAFILPLFYVAWTIYPVAYIVPVIATNNADLLGLGLVLQQAIYTIADIASKIIYGVILTIVATILSREQGFKET
ncbi:MAG: bacteriorhodopsin [Bacillota bacterium]